MFKVSCSRLEHDCRAHLVVSQPRMPAAKTMNIVGERVKQARLRRKPPLTQDELSGKLAQAMVNIDRAGISKIEIGARCVLDYEVKALAKALGVSVGWLLGESK